MDTGGTMLFAVVVLGCLGAIIGSFLNVVAYRVPAGVSIVTPPSACPHCGHRIRGYDNIPVLSWLLLRGRCRDCHEPISPRYPLVELATGLLFAGVAWWALGIEQGAWLLPAYLVFAGVSVVLTLIDLDTKRLPNVIVLPALLAGLVLLAVASFGTGDWWALLWAVVGAAALFVFYLSIALIYPAGMGMGDVKLAAVIGLHLAWLGWGALVVAAFAGFLLGGIFGLLLMLLGRGSRKTAIPYGPWMLAGAWVGIFCGNEVTAMYLALVGIN